MIFIQCYYLALFVINKWVIPLRVPECAKYLHRFKALKSRLLLSGFLFHHC